MIQITRGECPDCLKESPTKGDLYRRKEVVKALWDMQHGKCCYSERYLPQTGLDKHVEHFEPKSIFTWRRNEWNNLLLVSPQCNGRKSDQFPMVMASDEEDESIAKVVYLTQPADGEPAIVDPCSLDDDPERHLTYVLDDREELYGQVIPREESPKGRITIEVTGIDDDIFYRERFERLTDVLQREFANLLRVKKGRNEDAVKAAIHTFEILVASNTEYAGLARDFAREKKLDERFGLVIPVACAGIS
ncbi:MAG: hypothetical protein O7D91_19010 [Planctomycetota bacterium]|nr:hypothetical protein [Planctomycetota bacterium]